MPPEPNQFGLLVGRIAYAAFKENIKPSDDTFAGGVHAFPDFDNDVLVGIAQALAADAIMDARCLVRFPAATFRPYGLPEHYLTDAGPVATRNDDDEEKIVLVGEITKEDEASFRHTSRTDSESICRADVIKNHWIPIVESQVVGGLVATSRTALRALALGLQEAGIANLSTSIEYLVEVAQKTPQEGGVAIAAGLALPILGLPLYKDCFTAIRADKVGQGRFWAGAIRKHEATRVYLRKCGSNNLPLDAAQLRKRLDTLGGNAAGGDELAEVFRAYLESGHGESEETRKLLYKFDWSVARTCFETSSQRVSSSLATRTRDVLKGVGITLEDDEEEILDRLTKVKGKGTPAHQEAESFFTTHADELSDDSSVYAEWQKLIHGSKVTGSNLLASIVEAFHGMILSESDEGYRVVLEGVRQGGPSGKHNSLKKFNPSACFYFYQAYAGLETLTGGLVRFDQSLAARYGEKSVQAYLANNKPKPSTAIKANTLEFNLIVETGPIDNPTRKEKRPLTWTFDPKSILAKQADDFAKLVRFISESPKTALIRNAGFYERVGPKGTPPLLSLSDVSGMGEQYGAGGKGSFVPSKLRAKEKGNNLKKEWAECLERSEAEDVPKARIQAVDQMFQNFRTSYEAIIPTLALDQLSQEGVTEMATTYRELLEGLARFKPETFKDELIRIVLRIGNAEIGASGLRPAVSIICPWHPLRIEAMAARAAQFAITLTQLCGKKRPVFSDELGDLFFKEWATLTRSVPYPEISSVQKSNKLHIRVADQAIEGYTIHLPVGSDQSTLRPRPTSSQDSAGVVFQQMLEYLRLQPHERDNLTVALYDCTSASLPTEIVAKVEKHNQDNPDHEVTCQIYLMHRDREILRDVYQLLMTTGIGSSGDGPMEMTGDLLSRIRVNIVASDALNMNTRGEPVDLVFCKDVITNIVNSRDGVKWKKFVRVTRTPDDLFPHRWNRRVPVEHLATRTWQHLSCPAMTATGWAHLNALAFFEEPDCDEAWAVGSCLMPVNLLDFQNEDITKVFDETHKLGTWVINQDDILERKLLEDKNVKVIRYIQSSNESRNLVISSRSKDTLLRNTLKGRLQQILPAGQTSEDLAALARSFIDDANKISGGLFLKSARRSRNTGELMGMVLSKFIVASEIGNQPTAWCFLDDYAQWLGKREDTHIADLLVLSWDASGDVPVLDVIVTEAKFVIGEVASAKAKDSATQLKHTLAQIEEALIAPEAPIDQEIWLSRLASLFLSRINFTAGSAESDPAAWANMIRERKCKVRIRGYSHVFVHASQISLLPDTKKVTKTKYGIQEVFDPTAVRSLVELYGNTSGVADKENLLPALRQLRDQMVYDQVILPSKEISVPLKDIVGNEPTDDSTPSPDGGGFTPIQLPWLSTSAPAPSLAPVPAEPEPSKSAAGQINQPAEGVDEPETTIVSPTAGSPTNGATCLALHLAKKSSAFSTSNHQGLEWLKTTTSNLRKAFIDRQLPFQLPDEFAPILTPNAGIIRLAGHHKLTTVTIEAKANEIYTTTGIHILAVNSEPGRLRLTIARPEREMLHTEAVLFDFLTNCQDAANSEKLLVGIREEDGKPLLLDPFSQPHTLIAGATNSGKSVLMQNIILSIATTQSPERSNLFIIDPKHGVDYTVFSSLPHLKTGSGDVICTQAEAIECLEGAVDEMERRLKLMQKEGKDRGVGIPDIRTYRKITGENLPTWWIIHDEFADWMQTDEYKSAIPSLVNRLGVKARAAGIFLIFAAQRPDKDVFPMQLRDQLLNRLILQVASSGTSEIALGEKGAERLLGKGHMLAKVAGYPDPVFAQVPYIDPEVSLPALVKVIVEYHSKSSDSSHIA